MLHITIHNQTEKAECTITVYSHQKARKYTAVCRTNPKKKTQRCLESSILQYQISLCTWKFNHHITS